MDFLIDFKLSFTEFLMEFDEVRHPEPNKAMVASLEIIRAPVEWPHYLIGFSKVLFIEISGLKIDLDSVHLGAISREDPSEDFFTELSINLSIAGYDSPKSVYNGRRADL